MMSAYCLEFSGEFHLQHIKHILVLQRYKCTVVILTTFTSAAVERSDVVVVAAEAVDAGAEVDPALALEFVLVLAFFCEGIQSENHRDVHTYIKNIKYLLLLFKCIDPIVTSAANQVFWATLIAYVLLRVALYVSHTCPVLGTSSILAPAPDR